MSQTRKPDRKDEIDQFEDALVDSILEASEEELRADISAADGDPDEVVRHFDSMLVAVKAVCATERLREAQAQVHAFHAAAKPLNASDRAAAREHIDSIRRGDNSLAKKLLLAARKGQAATERDLNSLADDCAELERSEQGTGESDTDAS